MPLSGRPSLNERVTHVKTKIIATVGPATAAAERLRELVLAGVDLFRLNFAHGDYAWFEQTVGNIRQVSAELQRPIAILADLAGPKIRLGELPGDQINFEEGELYEFARTTDADHPRRLVTTYEQLVDDLKPGDRVLLADGTVGLRVTEKNAEAGIVTCAVEQPGEVRSRQGVNLPGVTLSMPSLTEKDHADLKWAVEHGLDFVGLSFVRKAEDVRLLQVAIDAFKSPSPPHIVAKIEKMEAVDDLDRILELTDAVMVARGDLGVEVDIAYVPGLQKRIIRLCNQHRIPVITATQMLDSMQRNSRPTRAEASDVANAVLDGSDAVMLSGETAVGLYPVESVAMMSRLAQEAERLLAPHYDPDTLSSPKSRALAVTEAVTHGACRVSEALGANLIVVATHSGRTAMAISKQRSHTPILGLSDSAETARRMCLYWGVTPMQTDVVDRQPQDLLKWVMEWGRAQNVLQSGSKLVLVASSKWSAEGHDLMLVHAIP